MSLSLLEQAKGGDADAIATLMNQALQSRGVTVRGQRQGDRLQLWLSASAVPAQAATVDYVVRGLERLQVTTLTTLEIQAESTDPQQPGWGVEVALGTVPPQIIPIAPQAIDQPAATEPPLEPETPEPEAPEPEALEPEADVAAAPAGEPGTIDYAYALLGLEPGSTLTQVEGTYFKLKAQALREGDRPRVEDLKRAFYQLKDYIENPPAKAAAPAEAEAPLPPSQDPSLPPAQRVEALLKERGVAAQVSVEGNQLYITWLAVRVINPEDAASQVHALLTQHSLSTMGLQELESLVISGVNRDRTVVWQQTLPIIKR